MPDQEPIIEGEAPKPNPTPAAPQAQAEAPVTMSALKDLLASTVSTLKTEIGTEVKNGINADLRRAGVFKGKEKPVEQPEPQAAPQVPSMSDIKGLLERDRVFTTRAAKHDLSDSKRKHMESALADVPTDQLSAAADAFLSEWGLVKAAPTTPAQPQVITPVQPSNAQPISDKGSPAPSGAIPDYERAVNDVGSFADAAAKRWHDAKHGVDKARRMRVESTLAKFGNMKVTPK